MRRERSEGPWTILAAVVGVLALIVTILGIVWNNDEGIVPAPVVPVEAASQPVVGGNLKAWEDSLQNQIRTGWGYEVVRVLREHSTMTDPETGFVYATENIGGMIFKRDRVVYSRYALPGERIRPPGAYDWRTGHTIPFTFKQRQFQFVVEEIDTRRKAVVVRIKELPSVR